MPDASAAVLQDILERVTRIEANCTPCQQTLKRHSQALDGRGGNAANPGLSTRMVLLEKSVEEAGKERDERRRTLKWFRVQMAGVLAGLLWFLYTTTKYFLATGG